MHVRDATPADGPACAAIYAPYVTDTAVTFETEAPTAAQMSARIDAALRTHAWLVLEDDGRIIGFAYGGSFRTRAGYAWTVEVSAYLERGRTGSGGGRALYEPLLDRLAARGFRSAVAVMVLPNDASVGLHRALGFEPIGTYPGVGWKLGRWHDVAWAQRRLLPGDGPAAPLR